MTQLLYIDPGSGFALAQIITAIAGGLIIFKKRLSNFFRLIFRKKDDKDTVEL